MGVEGAESRYVADARSATWEWRGNVWRVQDDRGNGLGVWDGWIRIRSLCDREIDKEFGFEVSDNGLGTGQRVLQ